MEKEILIKNLIFSMMKFNPDKLSEIENEIRLAFRDYKVEKLETSIVKYEGNINEEYIKHWLVSKAVEGCTERTIRAYGSVMKFILDRIGKNADEITTDDIRIYVALRQTQDGISKATADTELRYLRSFYAHLTAEEAITKNPCLKLKAIKRDKIKKKAFQDIEVEKIRVCCVDKRETAIIEMLLSTGCRCSELVSITRQQALSGDQIKIMGKGRKERNVYMNAKAKVAVQLYLAERNDDNPFLFPKSVDIKRFVSKKGRSQKDMHSWYKFKDLVSESEPSNTSNIEKAVRKIGKNAGIEPCHPHRFRRTCATMALRRGMPIELVSKMLGHESITTTQIYLDLSEDDLESAHGKYVV